MEEGDRQGGAKEEEDNVVVWCRGRCKVVTRSSGQLDSTRCDERLRFGEGAKRAPRFLLPFSAFSSSRWRSSALFSRSARQSCCTAKLRARLHTSSFPRSSLGSTTPHPSLLLRDDSLDPLDEILLLLIAERMGHACPSRDVSGERASEQGAAEDDSPS